MNSPSPSIAGITLSPETLQTQIQGLSDHIVQERRAPGISIELSINGQRVKAQAGRMASGPDVPMEKDARFHLGCITKLFTSIIAAILIDDGLLDEEAPIGRYIEELQNTGKGNDIAIWHLMSHTSGYRGFDLSNIEVAYHYSWAKFLASFISADQRFTPGTVFSYEHTEHVVLGEIIQRLTGQNITSLFHNRIFEPLGLCPGTINLDRGHQNISVGDHVYLPAKGVYGKLKAVPFGKFWSASLSDLTLSISDLVSLAEAIAGFNQPAIPVGIAPPRFAMDFVQKQVIKLPATLSGKNPEQLPGAFGAGCAAYQGWLLGHNGSSRGQTCGLRFDPRNNIALAVGLNTWDPCLRDRIINHIFGALRGQSIEPFQDIFKVVDVNRLAGTYLGPGATEITIRPVGMRLICSVRETTSAKAWEVVLIQNTQGELSVESDIQHFAIGFFTVPGTEDLALMWGLVAFKRL